MATRAQVDANRRNAEKSTGPQTDEGKQIASRNALKLGLFSTQLVLPDEDATELEALRAELLHRFKPADVMEHLYTDRIVCAAWRLRRALAGEAALYAKWRRKHDTSAVEVHTCQYSMDDLDRLQRHIASLERAMDKATAELTRLQKLRRQQEEQEEDEEDAAESNGEIEANSAALRELANQAAQPESPRSPIEIVGQAPARENSQIEANSCVEDVAGDGQPPPAPERASK